MAKKPTKTEPETGQEITLLPPSKTPLAVIASSEEVDSLIAKIKEVVENFTPDTTTAKGRAEIKSLAFKVTRAKTALDEAGKELNAGKRAEIDAVDEVRRKMRADLDALAEKARKPLTDWEEADERRKAECESAVRLMETAVILQPEDTAATIALRLGEIEIMEFDADIYQDWLPIAVAAKTKALDALAAMLDRAKQAEADAAELARLRKEKEDREAADAARVAEETRKREEAEREEARKAALANATAEARAHRQADIAAAIARLRSAIARLTAEVEAAAQVARANAEAEALRAAEAKRLDEIAQAAAEQAARDKDRKHRSEVMSAAKEALMSAGGIAEEPARQIVRAIIAGDIPNVELKF